jgi:hemoglobin/transferrin/lactoferrin receptor protein
MTRYICLINIICLFVQLASSQMVVVKDKETHLPLEHVSIFTEEPIRTDFTDAHGKCNLDEFAGADSIFFHMIGYETSLYSYDEIKDLGFQVLMRQHEMSLNEVVIAATKWQQGRRETPAKVSVMKPKEVQFANPQTTADLIGMNGDVYIQKSQMGGGSPMIRGFATNRVLIAVDGVRMNNIIFRGGNLQNIISADAYTLERAEVIFGPGSVIYGSDAIGGVMGLYTFNPGLANEG